jgi:cell division topological specificity factor
MGILDIFFRNKSKDVAKQRLTMVLAYERRGLAPNFIESLRDDLIAVFSKYYQFDVNNIEVELKKENSAEELWISIPLKNN